MHKTLFIYFNIRILILKNSSQINFKKGRVKEDKKSNLEESPQQLAPITVDPEVKKIPLKTNLKSIASINWFVQTIAK